jgi:hypothetical protein
MISRISHIVIVGHRKLNSTPFSPFSNAISKEIGKLA